MSDILKLALPGSHLFNFEGHSIRVVFMDGEYWWVLLDVCIALGIVDANRAASRLDPKGVRRAHLPTEGGMQWVNVINRPNYFRLIFKSVKPEAVRLQDFTYEIVLPTLQETGSFSLVPASPAEPMDELEALLEAVKHLAETRREQRRLALKAEQQEHEIIELTDRVEDQGARLDSLEHNTGWRTVLAVAKRLKLRQTDTQTMARLGTRAAYLTRSRGLQPGKVGDQHWDGVGLYPVDIIKEAIAQLGIK